MIQDIQLLCLKQLNFINGKNILETVKSKEDFEEMLKEVTLGKVKGKLKSIKDTNSYAETLLEALERYTENEDVEFLRDNLANALKHRGNIKFKGVGMIGSMGYKNGKTGFDLKYIEPTIYDMDETIERLKRKHKELIKLVKFVVDFMDFDAMFKYDEKGAILFNIIKDPKEYKKVIFK